MSDEAPHGQNGRPAAVAMSGSAKSAKSMPVMRELLVLL